MRSAREGSNVGFYVLVLDTVHFEGEDALAEASALFHAVVNLRLILAVQLRLFLNRCIRIITRVTHLLESDILAFIKSVNSRRLSRSLLRMPYQLIAPIVSIGQTLSRQYVGVAVG